MAQIIRGTTPTIQYTFNSVTVANITHAYLTIKQGGVLLAQRDLTTATVGAKTISWTLTQAETLAPHNGQVSIMINWLLPDGTRGASAKTMVIIDGNHIEEVIP